MLNLTRLKLLHELSVLGSISSVAAAMNITRPAVSQQLSLLERETGTALFERSAKGVRLTAAGERMVHRVSELLITMTAIEADLASEIRELSGEIRIAGFGSAASSIIPVALARLAEENPRLRVLFTEMEPSDALRAVAARQMDLVVVDDLLQNNARIAGLEHRPLIDDHFKAVLSADHRLVTDMRRFVHLNDLSTEEWALNQSATTYASFVTNACQAEGFKPIITCSCQNIVATLEFVRTGRFVTVLPSLATPSIQNDPDFRIMPLRPTLTRRTFCAFAKGNGDHPAIVRVLDALVRASRIFA